MKHIYLDYAAATPMDPAVKETMEPYWQDQFYNPSATYLAARDVRRTLAESRAKVAAVLGCRPAEVIFTAGATEANNLAIQGIMQAHPGLEVLTSAIEHESVLAPASKFTRQLIPVNEKGVIDLAGLEAMLGEKTVLVSVMLINNELGTIQPIKEISEILNKLRKSRRDAGNETPLYFHTDAAQAPSFLDLHVSRLGVDLASINGSKIYGPKQSGALYVRAGVDLQPLIVGGGQEFGLRSGTENIAATAGFTRALELAQAGRHDEAVRISGFRQKFEEGLRAISDKIIINGSGKHRAPHITSVTFAGTDNERMMMELDELGIMAATGSACSASSDEPSHVLAAIGLSDEQARSTLRFSFGRQTTENEIESAIKALTKLLTDKL